MQLVEDKLKNPCLDYVQHIVFAAPDATFATAGATFSSFEAVRDAFLSEKLSEEHLKAGLIEALNKLLEPVRSHFDTDPEAGRILKLITGWMAEPKDTRPPPLRRLAALDAEQQAWVVYAPLPSAQPTVAAALDTLRCLKAAPAHYQKVLWLSDWSAFCLNCLSGGKTNADDLKAIGASNDLFVAGLKAVAPTLMADVHVVHQSKALLRDPSDYWISVINAGRAFQLSRVLAAVDTTSPDAGHVLSSLMHVADVLAIAGKKPAVVCGTQAQQPLAELALEYMRGARLAEAGLVLPELRTEAAVSLRLKADEGKWDPEAELLLLDGQPDVQRKLKRAFCEPGNVDFCPPVVLAEELLMQYSTDAKLVVARKPDNGGDQHFSTSELLRGAFASGELHPGDLKPSVRDGADAILERVRKAIGDEKALKEAEKELAKVLKRKKK